MKIVSKTFTALALAFLLLALVFAYGALVYPPSAQLPSAPSFEPPSAAHILGADNLGIDIFAQLSRGFFTSMAIGLASAALSFALGGILGLLSGYLGGGTDAVISFFINLFLSIPQLPVMIVTGVFFGQSFINVVIIISAFSWAPIAKLTRAKTMDVRSRDYIKIARSYGAGPLYIFKTHLLKDTLPIIAINSLSVIGKAIVMESSLAFLGLSDPTAKSWGMMIGRALNFSGILFTDYWKWWLIPPTLCLVITILVLRFMTRELESAFLGGALTRPAFMGGGKQKSLKEAGIDK